MSYSTVHYGSEKPDSPASKSTMVHIVTLEQIIVAESASKASSAERANEKYEQMIKRVASGFLVVLDLSAVVTLTRNFVPYLVPLHRLTRLVEKKNCRGNCDDILPICISPLCLLYKIRSFSVFKKPLQNKRAYANWQ